MESENFKRLPLWMPSDNECIGAGEYRRPDRLPIKIFITAIYIDKENEKRYWNINYQKIYREIVSSDDGPGDRISIDIYTESNVDEIDFTAKHEDFDTACQIMYHWLEKNDYIQGYKDTLALYKKVAEQRNNKKKQL